MSELRERFEAWMRRWIDNKDDLHAPTRLQIFEAGYQAASEAERAPDLVIRRLPDWNYAAFLNETDASCIAIGTTEQEVRNNGMRELLKGYAERAAGVREGFDKGIQRGLAMAAGAVPVYRERIRALIPQPAAQQAEKVEICGTNFINQFGAQRICADRKGHSFGHSCPEEDAQPTSAAIMVSSGKHPSDDPKYNHAEGCQWPLSDCTCMKTTVTDYACGKCLKLPCVCPPTVERAAPAPILGEPQARELLRAWLDWATNKGFQPADPDSIMKRTRDFLLTQPPAILGELEGLRERIRNDELYPDEIGVELDALIKRLGASK